MWQSRVFVNHLPDDLDEADLHRAVQRSLARGWSMETTYRLVTSIVPVTESALEDFLPEEPGLQPLPPLGHERATLDLGTGVGGTTRLPAAPIGRFAYSHRPVRYRRRTSLKQRIARRAIAAVAHVLLFCSSYAPERLMVLVQGRPRRHSVRSRG